MDYMDWKNVVENMKKSVDDLQKQVDINKTFLVTAERELSVQKVPELPPVKELG